MKKLYFWLLFLFIISSCTKEETPAPTLIGDWEHADNKYLISLNQDYNYANIFGDKWQGTVNIDNHEIDTDFEFIIDNVIGGMHFYSSDLKLTFHSLGFNLYYNKKEYIFTSPYTINLIEGTFTATGQATCNQEQLEVEIALYVPKRSIKKDVTFELEDAFWFTNYPFTKLKIEKAGHLQGKILEWDVMLPFEGNWTIQGNTITLTVNELNRESKYSFHLINRDTLALIQPVSYNSNHSYGTIPDSKITQIKKKLIFVRQ